MAIIKKKIWPEYFKLVKSGKKKFELRVADFKLKEGDILILEEWDPKKKEYTGRIIRKKVRFILKFKLDDFNQKKEIEKKSGEYNRTELWKSLPRKVMWQTFQVIMEYLESIHKIVYDREGFVVYIWNPEFFKKIRNRPAIKV